MRVSFILLVAVVGENSKNHKKKSNFTKPSNTKLIVLYLGPSYITFRYKIIFFLKQVWCIFYYNPLTINMLQALFNVTVKRFRKHQEDTTVMLSTLILTIIIKSLVSAREVD